MKIGYLMNTYPVTSGSFIRREIHALEARGVSVSRFAVRRWDQELVDEADRKEGERTQYLLSGRALWLLIDLLMTALRRPIRFIQATRLAAGLWRRGGGLVRHAAYLAEAASLMRMSRGLSHIHCHFSTNAPAVAMLSHALGGPTFSFTAHGPDEFDDVEANSLATKIEHSRLAVAITEYAKSVMTRAGGAPDKVHVVGCGLDLAEFPAPPPSAADAPLVCVGRLCPQKAQTLIPAAIAEAAKAHPDLKIRLIGDGESRAEVEAEIERCGVADRVTLLGWRSNDEVRAEIVAARALVLPSFAEGLPIVIMEAFALQRPVITTRITGIPELVDESCGWLIEPGDGAALAEAVSACMDAPADALSAMGAEGRARIEARHDIGKSAAQLEALFRS